MQKKTLKLKITKKRMSLASYINIYTYVSFINIYTYAKCGENDSKQK